MENFMEHPLFTLREKNRNRKGNLLFFQTIESNKELDIK